jgi:hypothetical protein
MTPKQKIFLASGIFAVFLLLFFAFLLLPLMRGVRTDSAKVLVARVQLAKVSLYEEQIQKFEGISQSKQDDLDSIHNLFLDTDTPIAFLEFLEERSTNSQISLKITPVESQKKEEDTCNSTDFELAVRGFYPNVCSFVKQVENGPYLFEFKNVMLQRLATGEVDFSLLLKVYTRQ